MPVTPVRPAIALVGFMGAGKSTAANAIAAALREESADVDELIEAEAGRSIAEIFASGGEAAFREIEERIALAALERGGVVALGGGAVESEAVRDALRSAVVAWCRVDVDTAWSRCAGSQRPLARDREEFNRRFEAREPIYEAVSRAILPAGGAEAGAFAAPWLAALREAPDVRLAWARTASASYPVLVGAGATRLSPAEPFADGRRRFAVADRAAVEACGELLPAVDGRVPVAGGEGSKTLGEAERVLEELADLGVRRDDALVAFGGGVVGDLGGFCAAVYQRGIPVVQVPTTLVAQVDSAIGGKTGVDLPRAKNYVGAYHQPAAVLADPVALRTLPRAELAAGFAEVVKTALIAGGSLWERVRTMGEPTAESVEPLVFDCARTKVDVVAADERDAGLRAVLNLGHTVGHGIETAAGHGAMRHGEAIAIGLLASLRLSGAGELRDEVESILARAGLPTRIDPRLDTDAVLEAVGRDKKRDAGGIGFVLVREPGSVEHGQRVGADTLRAAVEELR